MTTAPINDNADRARANETAREAYKAFYDANHHPSSFWIAKALNIPATSFYKWQSRHRDFSIDRLNIILHFIADNT